MTEPRRCEDRGKRKKRNGVTGRYRLTVVDGPGLPEGREDAVGDFDDRDLCRHCLRFRTGLSYIKVERIGD